MVGERMIQYLSSVAIPATKTIAAGSGSVVTTAVYNPFEQAAGQRNTATRSMGDTANYPQGYGWLNSWGNFGAVKLVMRAANRALITADSVLLRVYVSFDKGGTYQQFGSYYLPAAGSTSSAVKFTTIPYAPRLYMTATISAATGLAAGHGLGVDLEFEEYMTESYRTVTALTWADTRAGWATSIGKPTYLNSPDTKFAGDSKYTCISSTVVLNQFARPQRIAVVGWAADVTQIQATVGAAPTTTVWAQASLDGTYWYNADTLWLAKPLNGTSGIFTASEELKPVPQFSNVGNAAGVKEPGVAKQGVLSKYLRLQLGPGYTPGLSYTAAAAAAGTGGQRFWVIAYY